MHQPQQRQLLCYAEGREAEWEAICVDLDIAVQGRTFEDVSKSLSDAIELYVAAAREEAPEDARRLLGRQAPLVVRIAYAWRFVRASLLRTGPTDRSFHNYQTAYMA